MPDETVDRQAGAAGTDPAKTEGAETTLAQAADAETFELNKPIADPRLEKVRVNIARALTEKTTAFAEKEKGQEAALETAREEGAEQYRVFIEKLAEDDPAKVIEILNLAATEGEEPGDEIDEAQADDTATSGDVADKRLAALEDGIKKLEQTTGTLWQDAVDMKRQRMEADIDSVFDKSSAIPGADSEDADEVELRQTLREQAFAAYTQSGYKTSIRECAKKVVKIATRLRGTGSKVLTTPEPASKPAAREGAGGASANLTGLEGLKIDDPEFEERMEAAMRESADRAAGEDE